LAPVSRRNHPLRVNLAYLGHPILAHMRLQVAPVGRMLLHAYKLEITLLNREKREFIAEVPEAFDKVVGVTEVVLHLSTDTAMKVFVAKPTHEIMLQGPPGMGKGYVAQYLASQLLNIPISGVLSYPYLSKIEPEKNSISIDQVRATQKLLTLRVPGLSSVRRI